MRMAEISEDGYHNKKQQSTNPWKEKEATDSTTKEKNKEVKTLSREEVQECIKKWLCFNYGEN